MKKLKSLGVALMLLSTSAYAGKTTPNFTLHTNGKTILCPNASVGDSQTVDGVTYTKIDNKNTLIYRKGSTDATQACTSGVTSMSGWFDSVITFNKDISHWDTSSVTTMYQMFFNAKAFNQDISDWNTSSVTNMSWLFSYTTAFNQDISKWDTSSVTGMFRMFLSAKAFNQDIGDWNTSSVNVMDQMFTSADAFNQNISTWCVSNITSKPTTFDESSGFADNNASQPTWGTCPVTNSTVSTGTATPPAPTPKELVESFVGRLYEHILSRVADKAGTDYWTSDLTTKGLSAYEVVVNFFESTEYLAEETSGGGFVDDIYVSILDRKVDAAGYHYWVTQLKNGLSREEVLDALLRSKEFEKLSADYGVKTFPEE